MAAAACTSTDRLRGGIRPEERGFLHLRNEAEDKSLAVVWGLSLVMKIPVHVLLSASVDTVCLCLLMALSPGAVPLPRIILSFANWGFGV